MASGVCVRVIHPVGVSVDMGQNEEKIHPAYNVDPSPSVIKRPNIVIVLSPGRARGLSARSTRPARPDASGAAGPARAFVDTLQDGALP
jgi:hypothetical protein